jgi:hypothetical protein
MVCYRPSALELQLNVHLGPAIVCVDAPLLLPHLLLRKFRLHVTPSAQKGEQKNPPKGNKTQ